MATETPPREDGSNNTPYVKNIEIPLINIRRRGFYKALIQKLESLNINPNTVERVENIETVYTPKTFFLKPMVSLIIIGIDSKSTEPVTTPNTFEIMYFDMDLKMFNNPESMLGIAALMNSYAEENGLTNADMLRAEVVYPMEKFIKKPVLRMWVQFEKIDNKG